MLHRFFTVSVVVPAIGPASVVPAAPAPTQAGGDGSPAAVDYTVPARWLCRIGRGDARARSTSPRRSSHAARSDR